jgi:dihydroorotate dehydrogenase (NAD+) catalytic subunit
MTLSDASLQTSLGALTLANPVMPASGCFGPELSPIIPLERLGALVTKTVFAGTRSGNPAHRLAETAAGMLNAVGIPSVGATRFLQDVLPAYLRVGVPVIVSIGGLSVSEYWDIADALSEADFAALEVNVSCPNLEQGGLAVGSVSAQVEAVIAGVVARTARPVIAKLTPNVTHIADIASAAEAAGASALTVANTVVGMSIDFRTRRAVLGNGVGGLSGPAIKPIALRKVWEAASAVAIPIIGCGGVSSADDVVEFLLAGATAVQVGTATFTHPETMIDIIDALPQLLASLDVGRPSELISQLSLPSSRIADLPVQ